MLIRKYLINISLYTNSKNGNLKIVFAILFILKRFYYVNII